MQRDTDDLLEQTLDKFLASCPSGAESDTEASGRGFWAQLSELGVLGVPFSAADGGYDMGVRGICLTMHAFGKSEVPSPYFATVVQAGALLRFGASSSQRAAFIPAIVAGDAIFATEAGIRVDGTGMLRLRATAGRTGNLWILRGRDIVLKYDRRCSFILVVADTTSAVGLPEEPEVFLVAPGHHGVELEEHTGVGGSPLALCSFNEVVVEDCMRLQGGTLAGHALVERAWSEQLLAVSAEVCGSAQDAFDATVRHLAARRQFGRPISDFQALRHRIADMYVALEQMKSMYCIAMSTDDCSNDTILTIARRVYILTMRGADFIGKEAIQMHGAIGMSQDCKVGRIYKRVLENSLHHASPEAHLSALAGQIVSRAENSLQSNFESRNRYP